MGRPLMIDLDHSLSFLFAFCRCVIGLIDYSCWMKVENKDAGLKLLFSLSNG